ncbi:Uncharacterised protein [uncultured archaeon]|nr:Uncharacterised protein [uncultured archaeon]
MELQKTKREISWKLYTAAFIISAIIFGIGMWTGLQIEKSVTEELSATVNKIDQQWISLETLMLMDSSPAFCDYLTQEMGSFDSETFTLGQRIGYMEERKGVDPSLKSEYMSLEVRDYLVANKINERCGANTSLVLYFVSSSNCSSCKEQGAQLTAARERTGARVYTFDMDVKNGMVSALAGVFKIGSYPSIVIDSEKQAGRMTADQIVSRING